MNGWIHRKYKFNEGVSREQFLIAVDESCDQIQRLKSISVDGLKVVGLVESKSGLSAWKFTVDFDNSGHLTGQYRIRTENEDSIIPQCVARKINEEIEPLLKGHQKEKSLRRRAFLFKHWKILLVILFVLILCIYAGQRNVKESMQREITISSVDCIGKDYKEVIQEFKSAGFINISTEESEDLEYEELNKKDTVKTITINGKKEFKRGESYMNVAKVYLIYHSPKRKPVPISAKDAKGKDFQEVKKLFNEAGFYNIELEQDKDLITGWITKAGEVESISVGGDEEFTDNIERVIDSKIKIKYHTFKDK